MKPARRPQQRADRELVDADDRDQDGDRDTRRPSQKGRDHDEGFVDRGSNRRAAPRAKIGSEAIARSNPTMPPRGTTTRSTPSGMADLFRRNASRRVRLIRLRPAAVLTFFLPTE